MGDNTLFVIAQAAGAVLLGGVLALLWKGRIYLDSKTHQPTEFEFPVLGKFKTQSPVIALVLIAAVLVIYPIVQAGPAEGTLTVPIEASGQTVTVRLVPVPTYQLTVDSSGTYPLKFPMLRNTSTYLALYEIDHHIIDSRSVEMKHGKLALPPFEWDAPAAEPAEVRTEGVTHAELRTLGIP